MKIVWIAAAGLAFAGFASAAPGGGQAGERAAFAKCVAGKDARACIGNAAKLCRAQPGGETTMGMMDCAGRERALWDERLNGAYAALRGKASPTQATALQQAQRAWMAYRDARCGFEATRYEGGSLAGVVAGNCFLQVTAERALELTQQAKDWDQP